MLLGSISVVRNRLAHKIHLYSAEVSRSSMRVYCESGLSMGSDEPEVARVC